MPKWYARPKMKRDWQRSSILFIGGFKNSFSAGYDGELGLLQCGDVGLHRKPREEDPNHPKKLAFQRQGREQRYRSIASQR